MEGAIVDELCGGAPRPAEATDALDAAFGPCDADGWLLRVRDCDERFIYAACELERLPDGPPPRRARRCARSGGRPCYTAASCICSRPD